MTPSTARAVYRSTMDGAVLTRGADGRPKVSGTRLGKDAARSMREQVLRAYEPVKTRFGTMSLIRAESGLCTFSRIEPDPDQPDTYVCEPCAVEAWR